MLRYAVEIADALDHAHRRGLVHRDLKPGNIMLTGAGAKLLDFGVSKCSRVPASRAGNPLPTRRTAHRRRRSARHVSLHGTRAARRPSGRRPDRHLRIWRNGFEMATGQRAFQGDAAATLIGAILHTDPPPVSTLQPLAPPALDRIVARCLAKDPNDRWQTARDLMLELKAIAENDAPLAAHSRRRINIALAAAAVFALLTIAAAVVYNLGYGRFAASHDSIVRLNFAPPEGLKLTDLMIGGPVTISSDGERLAFAATDREGRQLIWVRGLGSSAAQPLPGTDGGAYPFWSPDSQTIGFFAQRKLKTVRCPEGLRRRFATRYCHEVARGTEMT